MSKEKQIKTPKAWLTWRAVKASDPKCLHKLIAAGNKLEAEQREHTAIAEAIHEEVKALKKHMLDTFKKEELRAVKTAAGNARLVPKTIYQPDTEAGGWDKIWEFIFKTKARDLLQKRLHEGAVKERIEAGVKIPGVKTFDMVVLKFGDAE